MHPKLFSMRSAPVCITGPYASAPSPHAHPSCGPPPLIREATVGLLR